MVCGFFEVGLLGLVVMFGLSGVWVVVFLGGFLVWEVWVVVGVFIVCWIGC